MANPTPELDDVEETKLDDDIDTLTGKIEDLEIQRSTMDVPEELLLNTGVNSDLLTQMAEKLKTMPRNKILQMINSLAKANQLPDHDFSTFSQGSVKSNSEKLSKKIKELRAKRTRLGFKPDDSNNKWSRVSQSGGKKPEDTQQVVEEKVVETHVTNSEEKQPTKLTKNQKKRLRKKENKGKSDPDSLESSVIDSASADSNLVSSVSESTA